MNFFNIWARKFHLRKYKKYFCGWVSFSFFGLGWEVSQVALIYTTDVYDYMIFAINFWRDYVHTMKITLSIYCDNIMIYLVNYGQDKF